MLTNLCALLAASAIGATAVAVEKRATCSSYSMSIIVIMPLERILITTSM
jgi:hypothetical protein